MDYYGKRLATCSSDRTIRIFDVVEGEPKGEPDVLRGSVRPSAPQVHLARTRASPSLRGWRFASPPKRRRGGASGYVEGVGCVCVSVC